MIVGQLLEANEGWALTNMRYRSPVRGVQQDNF
jgi:hypothetical protein